MKIIITGGSGLIGRALSADYVKDGHKVVILSRDPQAVQSRLPAGVQAVAWDGRTAAGWGAEAEGADAIVNLAGVSIAGTFPFGMRWTAARREAILNSRLNAGRAVVEAVQQAAVKPGIVVQAGAVGYYSHRNSQPFDETEPGGDDFQARVCAAWENSTAPLDGMVRRAVIRSGVVLAIDSVSLGLQALPFQMFVGGPIGNGRQGYPWIHIQDEVRAIRFLIENPQAQGVFNLTAPTQVTNAEFGRTLGKVLGRPYWLPVPGFVFKLAFGEVSTILLDGWKVKPTRLELLGFRFKFPEPEAALRDIYKK